MTPEAVLTLRKNGLIPTHHTGPQRPTTRPPTPQYQRKLTLTAPQPTKVSEVGSHCAAMDKPTRSARSHPPTPGPRPPPTPAPRVRRTPRQIPAAQGLGVDPQLVADASETPPGRSGSARAPRRQPDRAAPSSSGRFPGAGTAPHPSVDSDPPPHPGRSTTTDHYLRLGLAAMARSYISSARP